MLSSGHYKQAGQQVYFCVTNYYCLSSSPRETQKKMSSVEKSSNGEKKKKKNGSIRSIFAHADGVDMLLMTLGLLGAIFDGLTSRLLAVLASRLFNLMGRADKHGASDFDAHILHRYINKVSLYLSHTCTNTNPEKPVLKIQYQVCNVGF